MKSTTAGAASIAAACSALIVAACSASPTRAPPPRPTLTTCPTNPTAPGPVEEGPVAKATSVAAPTSSAAMTPVDATTIDWSRARAALATPNAGNGWIELVIPDRASACGPLQHFPKSCEPAWRVRISLAPEHQKPGTYQLGPDLQPFAYRDGQDKDVGAWVEGHNCKNTGGDVVGWLHLVAIESDGIMGVLSGAGEADGPFKALRCPTCKGTGLRCGKHSDCCNEYCEAGRCIP